MIRSKLCEMLHITWPVFQGGMAWIADGKLAAAVSEGGGLGIIGAGNAPGESVREQIRTAKALTERPFGVNIMLLSPYADEVARIAAEEKVAVVTTGAGNPSKYMPAWKEAGIHVIPVVASVAMAKLMTRTGASALIAEGGESGGHVGELTTMTLVPQICDATDLPVIAAGGIADGRGMAAAIMMGAQGVQIGTRFLAARECEISQAYKDLVLSAKDTGTVVTGRCTGHPCRGIRSRLTRELLEQEKDGIDPAEFEKLAAGSLRMAVQDGDLERGSFFAGQIAGMVTREQPAAEIIKEIATSAKQLLQNACMIRGIDF